MDKKTTALVARDVSEATQLRAQFDPDRYIVALPETHLERMPEGFILSARIVRVDPAENGAVYKVGWDPKTRQDQMALGKVTLDRIANAAGIKWLDARRVDDGSHPHVCSFRVVAQVTDFDGQPREAIGTKTVDLRADAGDGEQGNEYAAIVADAARAKSEKARNPTSRLQQARKFIAEICASKAMNRAIASLLGIKRSYPAGELHKPFVFAKLVPDPSHPFAQQATMAAYFGAQAALFGPRPEPHYIDADVFEQPNQLEAPRAVPPSVPDSAGGSMPPDPPAESPWSQSDRASQAAEVVKDIDESKWDHVGPPPMSDAELADLPDATPHARSAKDLAKEAWAIHREHGGDADGLRDLMYGITGKKASADLTIEDAEALLAAVKRDVLDDSGVPF